jgi:hypothetical protein
MAMFSHQIAITNSINYMQSTGCVSPNYMAQQFDINERMRAILIDWLIEVYAIIYAITCLLD